MLEPTTPSWAKRTLCPFIETRWSLMSYLCLNIAMQWAIFIRVTCYHCETLWHVVCGTWEHASWRTFLFSHEELVKGLRDRCAAGFRDRPFILKGLFTTLGEQGTTPGVTRLKLDVFHRLILLGELSELDLFSCVWDMIKSWGAPPKPLLKNKPAWCRLPPSCSFCCSTKPPLPSSFCEWDAVPGSVLYFLLVCVPYVF